MMKNILPSTRRDLEISNSNTRVKTVADLHQMTSQIVDVVVCNKLVEYETASFRKLFKQFWF